MKFEIHPLARALIFDLDGTLSDSLPVHIASWHTICKQLGCVFDEKIVAEMTGMPTIRFAERIRNEQGLYIDAEEIVRMKQLEFWNSMQHLRPHLPVVELMKKYHGKLPLAVGTGASRKSTELQLRTLGIELYFDVIVTADDVVAHKPEPETFLQCAAQMGISPVECQVFEDGDLGILAAKKAGMIVTDVRPFVTSLLAQTR